MICMCRYIATIVLYYSLICLFSVDVKKNINEKNPEEVLFLENFVHEKREEN